MPAHLASPHFVPATPFFATCVAGIIAAATTAATIVGAVSVAAAAAIAATGHHRITRQRHAGGSAYARGTPHTP